MTLKSSVENPLSLAETFCSLPWLCPVCVSLFTFRDNSSTAWISTVVFRKWDFSPAPKGLILSQPKKWRQQQQRNKVLCIKEISEYCCCCFSPSVSSDSFCDPMDCSLPGFSVCGISQARTVEWVAIPSSKGSYRPKDQIQVSCIAGRFFTAKPPGKPQLNISWVQLIIKTPTFIWVFPAI